MREIYCSQEDIIGKFKAQMHWFVSTLTENMGIFSTDFDAIGLRLQFYQVIKIQKIDSASCSYASDGNISVGLFRR